MAKALAKRTDEEISTMVKSKLAHLIEHSSDPCVVVPCVNALSKLLAVEAKMDEGDWMEDMASPLQVPNADTTRNPPGH